jgi:hypothetical protein
MDIAFIKAPSGRRRAYTGTNRIRPASAAKACRPRNSQILAPSAARLASPPRPSCVPGHTGSRGGKDPGPRRPPAREWTQFSIARRPTPSLALDPAVMIGTGNVDHDLGQPVIVRHPRKPTSTGSGQRTRKTRLRWAAGSCTVPLAAVSGDAANRGYSEPGNRWDKFARLGLSRAPIRLGSVLRAGTTLRVGFCFFLSVFLSVSGFTRFRANMHGSGASEESSEHCPEQR